MANINIQSTVVVNDVNVEILNAVAAALSVAGELIMSKSVAIVPVDEGVLRSSQQVDPPVLKRDEILVLLSYGGSAAEYAEEVHENLFYYHKPPTQAKYLEEPVAKMAPRVYEMVATMIRAASSKRGKTTVYG